jgi:hypothetical protein
MRKDANGHSLRRTSLLEVVRRTRFSVLQREKMAGCSLLLLLLLVVVVEAAGCCFFTVRVRSSCSTAVSRAQSRPRTRSHLQSLPRLLSHMNLTESSSLLLMRFQGATCTREREERRANKAKQMNEQKEKGEKHARR